MNKVIRVEVNDEHLNEAIQKRAFKCGFKWYSGTTKPILTFTKILFFDFYDKIITTTEESNKDNVSFDESYVLPEQYNEVVEIFLGNNVEKYEIGDWVTIYRSLKSGDSVHYFDKTFQINYINTSPSGKYVLGYEDNDREGGGIYFDEFRPATRDEITEEKKKLFVKGEYVTVTKTPDSNHWINDTDQRTFRLTGEAPFYATGGSEHSMGLKGCEFRLATLEEIKSIPTKFFTWEVELKHEFDRIKIGCKDFEIKYLKSVLSDLNELDPVLTVKELKSELRKLLNQ